MLYVSKAKVDAVGPEEYSAEVVRIPDTDVQGYLDNGWALATRAEWELVQSDEVKSAIANGEYSDDIPEGEATQEVIEPSVEVAPEA